MGWKGKDGMLGAGRRPCSQHCIAGEGGQKQNTILILFDLFVHLLFRGDSFGVTGLRGQT